MNKKKYEDLIDRARALLDTISPQRFFLLTALLFGSIFILITPPFQAPDEAVHFYRAYQISKFNLVEDKKDGVVGGVLPDAIVDSALITGTNPSINFHPNLKYNIHKTVEALSIKENPKPDGFYDFSSAALYPPVAYIPQSVLIAVFNALGTPSLLLLYAGRVASLLTWIIFVYFSIKLLPLKKWALVFIGLIPMGIFQAASLSADAVSIGLVVLFMSYILKLVYDKKQLSQKQMITLILIGTLMTLCKQAMFIFLPLVLLISPRIVGNRKRYTLTLLASILVPLAALAAWLLISRGVDPSGSYANSQDPTGQIKYILLHPFGYINVLWNTYFFTWGDAITRSFIGTFGWMDTPLSELFVVIGYIALAFVLIANYELKKTWLSTSQKVIVGGTMLLYWLGVSTALYVYYSPLAFKIIVGIQGRYLLPLAFLSIPLLYVMHLKVEEKFYRYIAITAPIFLLSVSAITIYFRYYINNV